MKANHGSTIRRNAGLMIFLALTLTACLPGLIPAPTPTLTPQPSAVETATVIPATATVEVKSPVESPGICGIDLSSVSEYDKLSSLLGPPSSWTQEEIKKFVDTSGNPIYPDVVNIVNEAKKTSNGQAEPVGVAIGVDGGYTVAFSVDGKMIQPVDEKTGQVLPRTDGGGVVKEWKFIPDPEFGTLVPIIYPAKGNEGGSAAVCNGFVVVVSDTGTSQIAGVFDPVYETYKINEDARPETAESVAKKLGLSFENGRSPYKHNYRIEGDKLMDYLTPVPTVAAVKENGVWRALGVSQEDKNLKYGALADSLGMEVLRATNIRTSLQPGTLSLSFNAVLTGEITIIDYEGSRVYLQKVVYKDGDGTVRDPIVLLPILELPGLIEFHSTSGGGVNTKQEFMSFDDALARFQPGKQVVIDFVWDGQMSKVRIVDDTNWQKIWSVIMALHKTQALKLKIFAQSWTDQNKNSTFIPAGMFIPARDVSVYEGGSDIP